MSCVTMQDPGTCCDATFCSPSVSVGFHVTGCSSLALGGATVSLDDGAGHTFSGTSVGTGNPNATISVDHSGTYTWTVSKSRFATATGSITITCGVTPSTTNVAMSAASGYTCCGFADPVPNTAYYSDANNTLVSVPVLTGSTSWQKCLGAVSSSQVFSDQTQCANSLHACPVAYTTDNVPYAIHISCSGGAFTASILWPIKVCAAGASTANGFMAGTCATDVSGNIVVSPCATAFGGTVSGSVAPLSLSGTWPSSLPGYVSLSGGALVPPLSGSFSLVE